MVFYRTALRCNELFGRNQGPGYHPLSGECATISLQSGLAHRSRAVQFAMEFSPPPRSAIRPLRSRRLEGTGRLGPSQRPRQ